MAVYVNNQNAPLTTTLVVDTDVTHIARQNVTSNPGTLYNVSVSSSCTASSYFKLANVLSGTVGDTAADIVLLVPASGSKSYVFPEGLCFNTGFTHWCVDGAAEGNVIAPRGGIVNARYVISGSAC
mgnify:CR=1 FL=1